MITRSRAPYVSAPDPSCPLKSEEPFTSKYIRRQQVRPQPKSGLSCELRTSSTQPPVDRPLALLQLRWSTFMGTRSQKPLFRFGTSLGIAFRSISLSFLL